MLKSQRIIVSSLVLLLIVILFNNAILWAEPVLNDTQLTIRFIQGSKIIRSVTIDEVMLVGIESVDHLAETYKVRYFEKLARDYPLESGFSLYYRVIFQEPRSDIMDIQRDFEDDPNIEIVKLDYDEEVMSNWIPDDFFFDFAPNAGWPCPAPSTCHQGYQSCQNGYFTNWGDVLVELWPLQNDGDVYARTREDCAPTSDPCEDWRAGWRSWEAEAGEDINAVNGWEYYLNMTEDPNGIPGDPEVLIGHMDTGVQKGHPEIEDALWYNPQEDHSQPGVFDPDNFIYDDGDRGSPSGIWTTEYQQPPYLWNGVPGDIGDDDNDGLADWHDIGIQEILTDGIDNDYDGTSDDEPGGPLCDCPRELVESGALKPDGSPYKLDDIGEPGFDDDNDKFIDECDGAMWDDDENGYVDDVIGWDFRDRPYGDHNPTRTLAEMTSSWAVHGTQTFGASAAEANNPEPQQAPPGLCDYYDGIDFNAVRWGMVGVCPDCKVVVLKDPIGLDPILYGASVGVKTFVQAAWRNLGEVPENADAAFKLGAFYIRGGNNNMNYSLCYPVSSDPDNPKIITTGGVTFGGNCWNALPSPAIDIAIPSIAITSTNVLQYNNQNGLGKWLERGASTFYNSNSVGCQYVAGAAGLLWSYSNYRNLNWDNQEVMSRLLMGSKKYEGEYHANYSRNYYGDDRIPIGEGVLDVHGALTLDNEQRRPPYLNFGEFIVDMNVGPGNGDGVVSQGEYVEAYVSIFNYGDDILELEISLLSDDPYVEISDGLADFSRISTWDSLTTDNTPFTIRVSDNAPPAHFLVFDFYVTGYFEDGNIVEPQLYENAAGCYVSLKEEYSISLTPHGNKSISYSPVYGELDGDPYLEIVTVTETGVIAINAENGALIWQNTEFKGYSTGGGDATMGDVNGDGQNEVVTTGRSSSYPRNIAVLDGTNGQTMTSRAISNSYNKSPVLADWDSDGDLDILIGDQAHVVIYDETLNPLNEIMDADGYGGISVGDLNNDGKIDIAISSFSSLYPNLQIYYNNYPEEPSSATINPFTSFKGQSPPAIGDVDNDGQLEVLYLDNRQYPATSNALLIDYDISSETWEPISIFSDPKNNFEYQHASIGDWNNDDILEMYIYPSKIPRIHVYNFNGGAVFEETIPASGWLLGVNFLKYSDILVADLNFDRSTDLIFRGGRDSTNILGLSSFGTGIWGEPYLSVLEDDNLLGNTTPMIGDFSGDGKIDIFTAPSPLLGGNPTGKFELFSTGGQNYNGALQWPQYRHDARRTSLYAQPVFSLIITEDITIWNNVVVWEGIIIEEGATLTIKPGTSIRMKPGSSINLSGTLVANGYPAEPISFVGTNPIPGSWEGIFVGPGANLEMKNCVIKDGDYGILGADAELATIRIDSTLISNISDIGIIGYFCDLSVTNSEISSCRNIGIDLVGGLLYAENNLIWDTGFYGIRVEDSPGVIGGESKILSNEIGVDPGNQIPGSIGIYCRSCEILTCSGNNVNGFDQAGIKFSEGVFEAESNIIQNITFNGLVFSSNAVAEKVFYNQIINTEYSVWCDGNSYPVLGLDDEELWGNNSFDHFVSEGVYNYNYPEPEEIFAQRNWWGATVCPELSTPVVCHPPLTQDPFNKAIAEDPVLPRAFKLHQNYPNPFNSNSIINFDLPRTSWVTIKVFNILGQQVIQLVDQNYSAGYHSVNWDGRNSGGNRIASGVYLYTISADDYNYSRKMVLLK